MSPARNRVRRIRGQQLRPAANARLGQPAPHAHRTLPRDQADRSELSPHRFLALVAKIGSPIAFGTTLLFYFGWVRAEAQARALGYDVTLLGLTTSDYVLRSVSVLFFPMVLLLLVALSLHSIHPLVLHTLEQTRESRLAGSLVTLLRFAWIWCILIGLVIFMAVPAARALIIPYSLTIGILVAIYGDHLYRYLHRRKAVNGVVSSIVILLLMVVTFWDVERLAGLMGRGVAEYIISTPSGFAMVTVFSEKNLELSRPGVVVKSVGSQASAYRHRYNGLRLLLHSDGKYFLLAYPPSGRPPVVIVLRDTEALRLEFAR